MEGSLAVVFIVDDDVDVCRAMSRLLRSAGYSTRTFSSTSEFLAQYDPGPPGCILLDLTMPEHDGLEVQAMLASSGSQRPIIFLTGNASIPATVSAIRAGAINFLTKPVTEPRLFEAVDEALRVDARQRSVGQQHLVLQERLESLTPRERQVLEQVIRGRLNKQVAADLGTVEKTIKVHRARVMRKMGARSLAELVQLASSVGLLGRPAGPLMMGSAHY
jgi:FixJ family two-component response regulator